MNLVGGHYVQSTDYGGTPFDVLSVTLSSPFATGTAQAYITNGPNAVLGAQEAIYNGTSFYTVINGVVAINNFFQVASNELVVQRNGTQMSIDFNPASPVAITLPPASFPAKNFSATWTLPAFHMDLTGTSTLGVFPSTPFSYPSGWRNIAEAAGYDVNVTFRCPSWNNFTTAFAGTAAAGTYMCETVVNRNINPSAAPFPGGVTPYTLDYYTGGAATVNFPPVGNITQMTIAAYHVAQSDHIETTDVLSVTLTGPLAKGTINPRISSNPVQFPYSATTRWVAALVNGTTTYTEVNGNVLINNIFILGPNEVSVQRNGTRVSVDFKPAKPVVVTLDAATFPPANFSSTFTIPAFHMDFNGYGSGGYLGQGNLTTASPTAATLPNGWSTASYYDFWPGNATFSAPSWNNFTTAATSVTVRPFVLSSTQAPFAPRPPLDVTARASVTVWPGWTWWFYVQNLGGQAPYTFQWYEGATLLQGQTSMVLPVTKNTPGVYTYYCVVTDSQGIATTSNAVTLTVIG
jgi:hypothetical protein